jgi:acyl-CoA thioester hydrolase
MTDRGVDLVVSEARVRYRAPARFDDELTMEIAVAGLGRTSVTTAHRVLRDDELIVEGELRHVFVELDSFTKTPIPDWARDGLAPWTLPENSGAER